MPPIKIPVYSTESQIRTMLNYPIKKCQGVAKFCLVCEEEINPGELMKGRMGKGLHVDCIDKWVKKHRGCNKEEQV